MKNNYSNLSEALKDSTPREKMLKKVRHALLEPSDNTFKDLDIESSVYQPMEEEKDVQFAYELSKSGANFIYCTSPGDMLNKVRHLFLDKKWTEACCNDKLLTGLLNHAGISTYTSRPKDIFNKIAVTSCEYLIARTGSIMVSSMLDSGRSLPFTCDIHIVIAFTSQVVEDLRQALQQMKLKYGTRLPSMMSVITGTSRTNDIEMTMVPGGYGAKELYVFMADEESTDN